MKHYKCDWYGLKLGKVMKDWFCSVSNDVKVSYFILSIVFMNHVYVIFIGAIHLYTIDAQDINTLSASLLCDKRKRNKSWFGALIGQLE